MSMQMVPPAGVRLSRRDNELRPQTGSPRPTWVFAFFERPPNPTLTVDGKGAMLRSMINRFVTALALFLLTVPALAATRVIDGDTLVIGSETIRILNIDTPEIHHAQCDAERRLGLVAKHRLEQLIKGEALGVLRGDGRRMKDRYGRTLARLTINGKDVGEMLVVEGLARRWDGKRHPWCD